MMNSVRKPEICVLYTIYNTCFLNHLLPNVINFKYYDSLCCKKEPKWRLNMLYLLQVVLSTLQLIKMSSFYIFSKYSNTTGIFKLSEGLKIFNTIGRFIIKFDLTPIQNIGIKSDAYLMKSCQKKSIVPSDIRKVKKQILFQGGV